MPYATGPDVEYRLVPIDGGPSIAERLTVSACPSCGADWSRPGSVRLGHAAGREYLCWSCMTYHRGRRVDAGQSKPVREPHASVLQP